MLENGASNEREILINSILHLTACIGNISQALLPLLNKNSEDYGDCLGPELHRDVIELQINFRKLVRSLEKLDAPFSAPGIEKRMNLN